MIYGDLINVIDLLIQFRKHSLYYYANKTPYTYTERNI